MKQIKKILVYKAGSYTYRTRGTLREESRARDMGYPGSETNYDQLV